eukprot:CAMPEP_0170065990 /NCGR_PEP_ID=MMETSP0019_2-20121128/5854_1 /TAXON_ID=98059 /ORGANISM="Dinobryon sp., Strain UTEXLB2267" /LENGTH=59 /DNA_ID=CAMNT_0010272965 /DNA_START=463 /DNA_END=642 /DNA_ORIENTATION=-
MEEAQATSDKRWGNETVEKRTDIEYFEYWLGGLSLAEFVSAMIQWVVELTMGLESDESE